MLLTRSCKTASALIQSSCLLMRKTVGLCIDFLLSKGIVLPVITEHHFCIKTQNVVLLLNSTGQNVHGIGVGALCRKTLTQQHTRISTFALSLYCNCLAWGHLCWKCALKTQPFVRFFLFLLSFFLPPPPDCWQLTSVKIFDYLWNCTLPIQKSIPIVLSHFFSDKSVLFLLKIMMCSLFIVIHVYTCLAIYYMHGQSCV